MTNEIMTQEFMVNMGPQHPSTHGVLRALITLDGEIVKNCELHIGYLHRAIEKIAENRTYNQFIPYTDRLDYVASMSNNFAYVAAVEKLLNVIIPPRADYIRVIIAELQRIASHLIWFSTFAMDVGAVSVFLYGFREREEVLNLFEEVCGARLTYNYFRIGGISRDLPEGFTVKVFKLINMIKPKLDEYEQLLTNNAIFLERTKNIGVIDSKSAISYGLSGPNLRATGYSWDIRKAIPYSVYPELNFDVPLGENGDIWDRYKVRIEEIRQCCKILEQAIDKLPSGDIVAKVPKLFKPAAGEVCNSIESPRGELGVYIVSDGSAKPYRLKWRAPSFSNITVIPEICKGLKIADLVAIIASLDPILGEIDR